MAHRAPLVSVSLTELRDAAAPLVELLRLRMRQGQIILHVNEYHIARVSQLIEHRPKHGDMDLDKQHGAGAE